MVFLKRRNGDSAVADLERELADLERRREKIQARITEVDDQLAALLRMRREKMLEADFDEGVDGRQQASHLRETGDELRGALAEVDGRISDARAKIEQQRDQQARQAEADVRTKQADAIETALGTYNIAAAQLIEAIEPAVGASLLSGAALMAIAAHRANAGQGIEAVIQELRQYASAVVEGATPMRPQPAPVEPPKPAPKIETIRVMVFQHSRWRESDEIKTAPRNGLCNIPRAVAERAIERKLAVPEDSDWYRRLRASDRDVGYGQAWGLPSPNGCLDLDDPDLPAGDKSSGVIHSGLDPAARKPTIGTATIARHA
jgi:hypothetical protein